MSVDSVPEIDPREAAYKDTTEKADKYSFSPATRVACVRREDAVLSVPRRLYVIRKDCLALAERLAHAGKKCIVLNFANNRTPGGPTGCKGRTQEEELFRRTNLCLSLDSKLYPIDAAELSGPALLYSEKVTVFKGADYRVLAKPFEIGVISCAAIALPAVKMRDDGGRVFRHPRDADITEVKMCSILTTAAKASIDVLILGAWGCGAFAGPLEGMVELWQKALSTTNAPPYVAFSILSGDRESEDVLMKAFGGLVSD